jgi:hypothetical protein
MSQFHYHAAAVPNRYADRVQQESTLFALMGWPKKPLRSPKLTREMRDTQIIAKAYALQKLWRARVDSLGNGGWDVAADTPKGIRDRSGAQRCRPTFFIPRGATGFRADNAPGKESFRVCKRMPICPFCYARWVREMWLRVDYTLFRDPAGPGREITEQAGTHARMAAGGHTGRARGLTISGQDPEDPLDTEEPSNPILAHNKGVDLLWWRVQQLVDPAVVSELIAANQVSPDVRGRRLADLPAMHTEGTALQQTLNYLARWEWPAMMRHQEPQKYHAVLGGLQSIVVEPYTRDKKRLFLLTTRRLMILPHGSITDNRKATITKNVTAEIKTIEQPSRQLVVAEMAKLLRYPNGLLRGDGPLTVEALHAPRRPPGRDGRTTSMQLNGTNGCLRTAVKKLKDAGIK